MVKLPAKLYMVAKQPDWSLCISAFFFQDVVKVENDNMRK